MTPTEPSSPKPRIPPELAARAKAARADRTPGAAPADPPSGTRPAPGSTQPGGRAGGGATGPSPARIIAAAAAGSAGLGLMAVMASQQTPTEIVIEVQPAPVVVETRTIQTPAGSIERVNQVEAATPAAVPAAAPVTESEGS